jgi:hypothetical protein
MTTERLQKSSYAPEDLARALSGFADALLPGDDLFPSASAAGSHGVLAARLRERIGAEAPELLARALIERDVLTDPTGAATRLEADEPVRFALAQLILTYAYYEAPAVIAAIRALGHDYNQAPQPTGYTLRPFDPARDAPATPRGRYIGTHEVARVDLSRLQENQI